MSAGAVAEVLAQAKINLRLRILAREDSGYHQIETLFLRIALGDVVRVRRTEGARSLDVAGNVDLSALGPTEANLAWRAASALADATEWRGGFAIEIEKRIPIGGGLGGGSADAGGVLRAMNAIAEDPLDNIMPLAARLGADVPFLASEVPYALAWGRGERMVALEPPPMRELVLVMPGFGVNTAEAYGWVDAARSSAPGVVLHEPREFSTWRDLRAAAVNDFEAVVRARHPVIGELVQQLWDHDQLLTLMSGSGSTLFSVFESSAEADEAARAMGRGGVAVIRSRTVTHVEPVQIIE